MTGVADLIALRWLLRVSAFSVQATSNFLRPEWQPWLKATADLIRVNVWKVRIAVIGANCRERLVRAETTRCCYMHHRRNTISKPPFDVGLLCQISDGSDGFIIKFMMLLIIVCTMCTDIRADWRRLETLPPPV